ncbi:MAG TPA: lytic transglycosylase domain-containing protein [Methylibium sp.]|nr:lytic transglycosylase domain-containing protein [Methylibium sp.]
MACALLALLLAPGARAATGGAVFATDAADGGLLLSDTVRDASSRVVLDAVEAIPRPVIGPRAMPRPPARPRPTAPPEIAEIVRHAGQRHGLDPALLHAVIATESGHAPRALSPRGAGGLMQLMPATAARYGVTDRFDPRQNVDAGARHLRELLDRFGQDHHLALAAYNAGAGAVLGHGRRIPPYRETQAYVPRVMQRWTALRGATERPPGDGP